MKNAFTVLLFFLISFSLSFGSEYKVGNIENGILINMKSLNLKVQFIDSNIIRIVKWNQAGKPDKISLSVLPEILNAHNKLNIRVEQKDKYAELSSGNVKVKISLDDGSIEFINNAGREILMESACSFKPVVYKSDSSFNVEQKFILSQGEGIYGLGEDQFGYMNYRGKTVTLVQTNTNAVSPFIISTNNYGILWDNYSKTVYTDDSLRNSSLWSDVGDNIDYYFISGENMDSVISGYRKLTGAAPLYGKWAYGYWQSKEHYATRYELTDIARKYRSLKMPIDNIVQDWDYWNGKENWGGMFFDTILYPRPKEMVDSLHGLNFHIMISVWPALGPNTKIYKTMLDNGYLFSPVGWAKFKYYDAFNPDANKVYWNYLDKGLLSAGIDGWWMDSTEPDLINANTTGSTEYEMKRVENNHLGSWARYLNAFSLAMTNDFYKNYRKENSDKRCYILTRSTYAGQQRNAATTWSGDIGASWDIYRKQISAGINHSMSGIPYFTFDIGAFVLGAYNGVFCNGGKDPAYQELYTRMFQFGVFCPIFRSHGSETPREIWEFGEFVKPLLKADNLRYRLMPYIYSLAWNVTSKGYTIMRGLPMDFPQDKKTYNVDDQFMFGPSVMVCPVTDYMYHRPPEPSVLIGPEFFKTNDGKPGILTSYYKDSNYKIPTKQLTEPNININWYNGRPDYVTDSSFSIKWEGEIIPNETGRYQFHMKSYDAKRIILDGKVLPIAYTSVEQYTDTISLEAGKQYNFVLETENATPGAAHMELYWKTPSIFDKEKIVEQKPEVHTSYLPAAGEWYNFWTGERYNGGQNIVTNAPIDNIPLFVKAGSIIPMGPFLQYSTEKPADPIELRIYPGCDCSFTLYEDENDNYNYEKGIYSTIRFTWDDAAKILTIWKREGEFPGMLKERTFRIIIVKQNHGTGEGITADPDKEIKYTGEKVEIPM